MSTFGPTLPPLPDDHPGIAIRRHTDGCFHAVEEVVKEGYIVDNILIPHRDVAEVRQTAEVPQCGVRGGAQALITISQ